MSFKNTSRHHGWYAAQVSHGTTYVVLTLSLLIRPVWPSTYDELVSLSKKKRKTQGHAYTRWCTHKAVHPQGGLWPPQESCYLRGMRGWPPRQAKRAKARGVLTVQTQEGAYTTWCTHKAVHTQGCRGFLLLLHWFVRIHGLHQNLVSPRNIDVLLHNIGSTFCQQARQGRRGRCTRHKTMSHDTCDCCIITAVAQGTKTDSTTPIATSAHGMTRFWGLLLPRYDAVEHSEMEICTIMLETKTPTQTDTSAHISLRNATRSPSMRMTVVLPFGNAPPRGPLLLHRQTWLSCSDVFGRHGMDARLCSIFDQVMAGPHPSAYGVLASRVLGRLLLHAGPNTGRHFVLQPLSFVPLGRCNMDPEEAQGAATKEDQNPAAPADTSGSSVADGKRGMEHGPGRAPAPKRPASTPKNDSLFYQGTQGAVWEPEGSGRKYTLRHVPGDTCCDFFWQRQEEWPTVVVPATGDDGGADSKHHVIGGVWTEEGALVAVWGCNVEDSVVECFGLESFQYLEEDLNVVSRALNETICPELCDVFDDGSGIERDAIPVPVSVLEINL